VDLRLDAVRERLNRATGRTKAPWPNHQRQKDEAIVYRTYGGPDVLEVAEAPEPKMMPDNISVKIKGVAGFAAPEFKPGDEVIGFVRGHETVLVHAAAGGVGHLPVQIDVAQSARVGGTASQANHSYLESIGVIPVRRGRAHRRSPRGVPPHSDGGPRAAARSGLADSLGAPTQSADRRWYQPSCTERSAGSKRSRRRWQDQRDHRFADSEAGVVIGADLVDGAGRVHAGNERGRWVADEPRLTVAGAKDSVCRVDGGGVDPDADLTGARFR
jgi:hypothetical protein